MTSPPSSASLHFQLALGLSIGERPKQVLILPTSEPNYLNEICLLLIHILFVYLNFNIATINKIFRIHGPILPFTGSNKSFIYFIQRCV